MRLLFVEDNAALQTTVARSFERRGIQVLGFSEGRPALERWRAQPPDVVLLDLSLPDIDGLELLSAARAAQLATPVIILTARGTVGDRILGLNLGADDYMPKPFDLDELEARVRALARRSRGAGGAPAIAGAHDDEAFCGLRVDADSGAIYHLGLPLDLPPREAALLRALLARPGQAVAKERLTEIVFADDLDVQPDAVEVVAYRLRKRLPADGARLVTLRGLGYLLKAPD
ncbi:two-component system response regulator TctD [Mitsuaria sp. BK045]|uniref:response regulator transcription factor n=1 Tax=unclassified Roseateles TaxID=2626991 RepID=UPI00160ABF73|nr:MULTISPECIES: response regulator transcription factor [unclassified Roseateles]MBB3292412.1 two-component system response regulator TctD [Mitsuaria sp. BK041]MBB3361629.1 two-component system response regulator TctD [Mitsuaria sp. BK045]